MHTHFVLWNVCKAWDMWRAYLKADWNKIEIKIKTKHSKWSGIVWWNSGHQFAAKRISYSFTVLCYICFKVCQKYIYRVNDFASVEYNSIEFVLFGFVVFPFSQYDNSDDILCAVQRCNSNLIFDFHGAFECRPCCWHHCSLLLSVSRHCKSDWCLLVWQTPFWTSVFSTYFHRAKRYYLLMLILLVHHSFIHLVQNNKQRYIQVGKMLPERERT